MNELKKMAQEAIDVINRGESVTDFLAGKGSIDPVKEWYDLRRWMKSNASDLYASIPIKLRLELPVKSDNLREPKEVVIIEGKDGSLEKIKLYGETPKEELEEEPKETPKEDPPKRKPGRPPKKREEEPVETKMEKKPDKPKLTVTGVQGQLLTYTKNGEAILIQVMGHGEGMNMNKEQLLSLQEEIPELLEAFKM